MAQPKGSDKHKLSYKEDPLADARASVERMKGFKGSYPTSPFKENKVRSASDSFYTPFKGTQDQGKSHQVKKVSDSGFGMNKHPDKQVWATYQPQPPATGNESPHRGEHVKLTNKETNE